MDQGAARAAAADGFTERLVSDVRTISADNLPERVLVRLKQAVLDWLGVTIAGVYQPSARITRQICGAEGGHGVARIIGTDQKMTARQAALITGIAGHALDYDDMGLLVHPSVVVLPAVFAVAEETSASGKATVEAILRGYEALRIVSYSCGQTSYVRGYHCTGTFGAFGAAIGAGSVLGMEPRLLVQALGVAGTQASGLKASFGTMSKHMNAGNAAAVGVLSARLAQAGYTGASDVIESPQGFAAAHNSSPADFDPLDPRLATDRLAVEEIIFKLHAACGGTHSAINGIREIKARRPFTADEVDEIELVVSNELPKVCGIEEPTTGLEGMFSIRYAASLAVIDSHTGPAAFTDALVRDPERVRVRERIRVTPVARIAHTGSPTEVNVRLKSGETFGACIDILVPEPDEALDRQWANLTAKFRDLVEPILGGARTEEIIATVQRIETLASISALTDLTAPAR